MDKMTIDKLVDKYHPTHVAVTNPILPKMGTAGSALVSTYDVDKEGDDVLLYVTIKDLRDQSEMFLFHEIHMLLFKYRRGLLSTQELRDNVKVLDRYAQVSDDDWVDVESEIECRENRG